MRRGKVPFGPGKLLHKPKQHFPSHNLRKPRKLSGQKHSVFICLRVRFIRIVRQKLLHQSRLLGKRQNVLRHLGIDLLKKRHHPVSQEIPCISILRVGLVRDPFRAPPAKLLRNLFFGKCHKRPHQNHALVRKRSRDGGNSRKPADSGPAADAKQHRLRIVIPVMR